MLNQLSPKFGPTTSSARKACPMWDPKLWTAGTARKSLLPLITIRFSSGAAVPGGVAQSAKTSRSLNVGYSSCPKPGMTARPANASSAAAAIAGHGLRMMGARSAR